MEELTREQLLELARRANKARRGGISDAEISAWLLANHGITRDELFSTLKALPREEAPAPLKTSEVLKLMGEGASFGLYDGVSDEREAELQDMGLGDVAAGSQIYGGGASVLGAGVAATSGRILAGGGATLGAKRLAQKFAKPGVRGALQEVSPSLGALPAMALGSPLVRAGAAVYGANKLGLLDRIFGR
jgi:hypothetical protein